VTCVPSGATNRTKSTGEAGGGGNVPSALRRGKIAVSNTAFIAAPPVNQNDQ
jgi:hypothetical protein